MNFKSLISKLFWLMLLANTATAVTIEVNQNCSLTQAIHAANNDAIFAGCVAGNGSDVILFTEPNQLLSVNSGAHVSDVQMNTQVAFPTIKSELIIEGNGLHIQADTSQEKFRVLDMIGSLGERLTLRNISISGGDDGIGNGSGLFVFGGRLTLENVSISDNRGGLLLLEVADAEITNAVIDNNWNNSDSTLSAGIESIGSNLILKNSSVINNRVEFEGTDFVMSRTHGAGGLGVSMLFSSVVINSTISGNSAITGGGIVVRENFINKTGGPEKKNSGLSFELINTTISNNSALYGGGMVIHESLVPIVFNHNLIAGNFATQSLGRELLVVEGITVLMDGFNVIQQHEFSPVVMAAVGQKDVVSMQATNELLSPLIEDDNLWVHHLVNGSDAIDVGSTECFTGEDQLNHFRPVDGNGDGDSLCDAGALEMSDEIFKSGFEM